MPAGGLFNELNQKTFVKLAFNESSLREGSVFFNFDFNYGCKNKKMRISTKKYAVYLAKQFPTK